jgi:hypothetical protein
MLEGNALGLRAGWEDVSYHQKNQFLQESRSWCHVSYKRPKAQGLQLGGHNISCIMGALRRGSTRTGRGGVAYHSVI